MIRRAMPTGVSISIHENSRQMKVLVTGGAGYIGSHTIIELIAARYDPVILDNFSNSRKDILPRLEKITGRAIPCIDGDIRDGKLLDKVFAEDDFSAVVHFAGLKAVGESVEKPLLYYDNNVNGTVSLLKAMEKSGVKRFVFSSSATVYGEPQFLPLTEDHPLSAVNPYGASKLMVEDILRDLMAADASWNIAILRYFNPAGAHDSGMIGEDPNGIPNNLMPYILKVAAGQLPHLNIFGDDYDTPDGTGMRDYIHVVDLAQGHIAALKKLEAGTSVTVNLGTGQAYSVLEMVKALEAASGHSVPYKIMPRRAGDVAQCYADPSRAKEMLAWQACRRLDDMCISGWHWGKSI